MVIIISSDEDGHVRFVTKHLKNGHVLIDAGTILEGKGLTYSFDASGLRLKLGTRWLTDITGVWLRRPRKLKSQIKIPVAPDYVDYCKSAIQVCFEQLYAVLPDVVWVSDCFTVEKAETKMYQLVCARQVGFTVPDTIVTSDKNMAQRFVRSQEVSIVKGLSRNIALAGEASYLEFYARKITPNDEIRYEGLHLAPCIFQQAIDPLREYRITVVGDTVFPAEVTLTGVDEPVIRDWHIGYVKGEIAFVNCTLPRDVAKKCAALVKHMGLRYGAIDLIEDKKGQFWFIEINPNGQWSFVEYETGQPIGAALAALLENRAA